MSLNSSDIGDYMAETKTLEGKRLTMDDYIDGGKRAIAAGKRFWDTINSGEGEAYYKNVLRNMIRNVGFDKAVRQVGMDRLGRYDAWAMWNGNEIELPREDEVHRIHGDFRDRAIRIAEKYGIDEAGLDQATVRWLYDHERKEEKGLPLLGGNHDRYEGLGVLADMRESDQKAYIAAVITYLKRKAMNDRTFDRVAEAFPQLKIDVEEMEDIR
jgi:hypothetical protein